MGGVCGPDSRNPSARWSESRNPSERLDEHRKHCETRAEPGRAQKSIEIKKTLNLGGPAGPKIEDWSSIGAWKATGKSSQYGGGGGGVSVVLSLEN